jgi:hypothetical protein
MIDRRPLSRVTRLLGIAATVCAALATSLAQPRAQSRPPIAIVGARIVDGSGNEPFTGTIVISGGRIAAVGRQVEAPADAQRIDGAGKAVLPGLIDTGAGGVDRSTDAGRRRLGRLLANGVTTAAVEGDPGGSASDPVQPRLVAVPPADASAAPAPPGGRALRSGTIGIAVGDAAAAAVSAGKAARARLALAGLTGDDGGIDVSRIGAAGLSPLDAVTAMTGGGAWALGLQSDRGLLAPGMRADLVVVGGDPSVSLDALTHVEHVFLGGVDVDRATLTRPAPPAPTAAPAPAAAPTPSAATPAASPTPAPKPPARTRTRGGKGSKSAPTSPPAAPAPAATDTPAPAAVPSPSATAPPVETPAPASASAAPEPAKAAPPEASPATAVAPVAPVVTAARLREPLLDDFERGDTVSAIGPAWVGSGSGEGGSATTLIMGRVVKGLRDHALLVSARMGAGREPYARAALKLDPDDRPVDVSRFRGLRFDARGEGRYRVVFVSKSVADGRYHQSYFSGSPLWTPVSIPFASIGQNGTGDRVTWSGRDVVEVRFEMIRDAGRLGWLELDNVTFY